MGKEANKLVKQIEPESLDDMLQASKMILLARKYESNGEIEVEDSTGKKAYQNTNEFCDYTRSFMDSYLYSHNVYFSSDILSSNIELLAKEHDMKPSDIERILNLSPGYISRASSEDARRRLSIDVVYEIATLFGVTVDSLINRRMGQIKSDVKPLIDLLDKLILQTNQSEIKWLPYKEADYDETTEKWDSDTSEDRIPYKDMNTFVGNHGDERFIISSASKQSSFGYILFVGKKSRLPRRSTSHTFLYLLNTLENKSEIIDTVCSELMDCIKNHKDDYKIPESVTDFISEYLS